MEPITVKFEPNFLQDIENVMKRHRYGTKSEFIREAIREKVRDLEKEDALARVRKLYGSSTRKTTDTQLRKAREEAFKELRQELK
ncbi:hypothetical protein CMI42_01765 [Candidatus Pacearchaeota archaeon]|jgi:Arc/MetJ-type ribon-helix-helix transcriptional regulator|nr:hypothetical protein [Candidatus Pacearchaeota archaeon]|tara:strand:+ start:943 stop:1197 length:255 start_codon:yes stop_codon:yes gene_type:complete